MCTIPPRIANKDISLLNCDKSGILKLNSLKICIYCLF